MCECRTVTGEDQKFRTGVGAMSGSCTCCGLPAIVVRLPAGGGYIYNCAACLNPTYREPKKKLAKRPMIPGIRFYRREAIPESFWRALSNDHTPITNNHPSAQTQKAAQRRAEEYD